MLDRPAAHHGLGVVAEQTEDLVAGIGRGGLEAPFDLDLGRRRRAAASPRPAGLGADHREPHVHLGGGVVRTVPGHLT
jgi:hypothetical protein